MLFDILRVIFKYFNIVYTYNMILNIIFFTIKYNKNKKIFIYQATNSKKFFIFSQIFMNFH